MDAAAEIGRNPVSKHQIQPGDEQADAGRDCRTRLARPNSQARTGTEKIYILPVQLATSRIDNLTRLIHTLLYVMTIHTFSVFVHGLLLGTEKGCIVLQLILQHTRDVCACALRSTNVILRLRTAR